MCFDDGNTLRTPEDVVCCVEPVQTAGQDTPGDLKDDKYLFGNTDKSFCKPSKTNRCTLPYERAPERWYSQCPQAIAKNCGGETSFHAFEDKQLWGMRSMRYFAAAPPPRPLPPPEPLPEWAPTPPRKPRDPTPRFKNKKKRKPSEYYDPLWLDYYYP